MAGARDAARSWNAAAWRAARDGAAAVPPHLVSAWLLRADLHATPAGDRTAGMIEYGNIVPYVLPRSRLVVHLPTKRNDYGFRVESVGFPIDVLLPADVSAAEVAAGFDGFVRR